MSDLNSHSFTQRELCEYRFYIKFHRVTCKGLCGNLKSRILILKRQGWRF